MGKGKRQAEESLPKDQKKKVEVEEKGKGKGKGKKAEEEQEDVSMDEGSDIEFEDPYEDEFEEEDFVEDEEDDEEGEGEGEEEGEEERKYWEKSASGEKVSFGTISELGEEGDSEDEDDEEDEGEDSGAKQVWRPGDAIEEGEELDYDPSTYNMLHSLGTQWPCLSFAFIPDTLGASRTKYPHTLYMAAGTQAAEADKNSLLVMKISRMNKTIEDSDDEFDSDDEGADDDPILETASFSATGGINRVKVMPQQDKNSMLALWMDTGRVHVYDIQKYMTAVDSGATSLLPKKEVAKFQVTSHKNEGFALDWSPTVAGRLLTGDCSKSILIHDVLSNKGQAVGKPFTDHTASVEDVQWSPNEKEVFASCSVDTTVRIWDARVATGKAMISVNAHTSDVNSLNWNKKVPYLLATGSDDCSFSIWDLRNFKKDATVAHFTFHDKPICCVEWNPNDDTQLVVVSEDNQVTIWDMSLEADDNEEPSEFPPQLFFMHQGQQEVKEAHWHPQIPNLIATTAADGFNLFITANSTEVAPPE